MFFAANYYLCYTFLQDTISRNMAAVVTKEGWLYKGPDSGKEHAISFTRV